MSDSIDYTSLFRLDGRKVVVVGGGSGLGRAASIALAQRLRGQDRTEALGHARRDRRRGPVPGIGCIHVRHRHPAVGRRQMDRGKGSIINFSGRSAILRPGSIVFARKASGSSTTTCSDATIARAP